MKCGRNQEGYKDPTAVVAIGAVIREQNEAEWYESEKRAYDLIKVLKYIIRSTDFELIERIQLKDTKTGREYR